MKKTKFLSVLVLLIMLCMLPACSDLPMQGDDAGLSQASVRIYLYGEAHGIKRILDKEFELWHAYYHEQNMRHLFVEQSYYTAEFLNLWMKSDNDDILEEVFTDWKGTPSNNPDVKEFYSRIKDECPETVFHGTDVGHQFDSTGERYLRYLKDNNLQESEQYSLAMEAIEQGKYYYAHSDDKYRENKMTENFKREYESLNGESIMGIYGAAHTGLYAMAFGSRTVPCMANQLRRCYGKVISSEDLSYLKKVIEPLRVDRITVNGKEYEASYFGKEDLTGFKDYACREFWRLENAYDDFRNNSKTGDVLPYDEYPMPIEEGQVFVIDYTKSDGSCFRTYYRSDGRIWKKMPSTEQFALE
jgi:hypothetical protein